MILKNNKWLYYKTTYEIKRARDRERSSERKSERTRERESHSLFYFDSVTCSSRNNDTSNAPVYLCDEENDIPFSISLAHATNFSRNDIMLFFYLRLCRRFVVSPPLRYDIATALFFRRPTSILCLSIILLLRIAAPSLRCERTYSFLV